MLNRVKSSEYRRHVSFLRRFFEKMSRRIAEILRRFCGDFSDFVEKIAPTHRFFRRCTKNVLNLLKFKNPQKINVFRGFLAIKAWVPGGTRTHDIQNHNLTL